MKFYSIVISFLFTIYMNIDNDELAKDIFVFSKDENYKNSKKLKYQFLTYHFFQNYTHSQ